NPRFGGNQSLGPFAPLLRLRLAVTAKRLIESFANFSRSASVHLSAPCFHAQPSGTRWSISIFDESKSTFPEYGSFQRPRSTRHPFSDIVTGPVDKSCKSS